MSIFSLTLSPIYYHPSPHICVFSSNLIQSSNQSHHYLIIPLNLRTHIYHINIYNAINLILCCALGVAVRFVVVALRRFLC